MRRQELVTKTAQKLKELGLKKSVPLKKNTFHITDDTGNSAEFTVKQQDKQVIYKAEDVDAVLEALMEVVKDALKAGDYITLRSFGVLGLVYHGPRKFKNPVIDEWYEVPEKFIPKFKCGKDLVESAEIYTRSRADAEKRETFNDSFFNEIDSAGGDA